MAFPDLSRFLRRKRGRKTTRERLEAAVYPSPSCYVMDEGAKNTPMSSNTSGKKGNESTVEVKMRNGACYIQPQLAILLRPGKHLVVLACSQVEPEPSHPCAMSSLALL